MMTENPAVYAVPGNNGGYPVVQNTGIPVQTLVRMHRHTDDFAELVRLYPSLSRK